MKNDRERHLKKHAYIEYGVMEGPLHGIRMRHELVSRGYQMVKLAKDADILIAHSGGYFVLPKLAPSQRLLLIDPAGHNGRLPLVNIAHHTLLDIKQVLFSKDVLFYFWKTGLNLLYLFIRTKQSYAMCRCYASGGRPELIHRDKTIIVQGDDTSWLNRKELEGANVHFLRSSHDECWLYPSRYLDFID